MRRLGQSAPCQQQQQHLEGRWAPAVALMGSPVALRPLQLMNTRTCWPAAGVTAQQEE
jgi:hypothetical protein